MKQSDVKYDIVGDDTVNELERQHISQRRSLRSGILRFLLRFTLACMVLKVIYSFHYGFPLLRNAHRCGSGQQAVVAENDTKVALEAHIMSKCPDARDCLQQLLVPTMEQVSDLVDFKLSYIGSVDPHSDEIACKHGPSECLGNIIELCAAKAYPDPKIYLGFVNCMTLQYRDIPQQELVKSCALEHGIDFQKLNRCISDEGNGMELLRKSVERSQENHVTKSCTVRLEGKVRCVRDGGEWYDCPGGSSVSELVADIKKLSSEKTRS